MLEDDHVLGLEVGLQGVALHDLLDLFKQVQCLFCAGDVLKRPVDEGLQVHLQVMDVDIEFQIVPIKLCVEEVQKIQALHKTAL